MSKRTEVILGILIFILFTIVAGIETAGAAPAAKGCTVGKVTEVQVTKYDRAYDYTLTNDGTEHKLRSVKAPTAGACAKFEKGWFGSASFEQTVGKDTVKRTAKYR